VRRPSSAVPALAISFVDAFVNSMLIIGIAFRALA
jgi:hypothetical protein